MASETSCGSHYSVLVAAQTLVKEVMIDGCELVSLLAGLQMSRLELLTICRNIAVQYSCYTVCSMY